MWISKRSDWSFLAPRGLEALVLALVFAFLPELVTLRAGAAPDPNPGWIAVLLLAARYGVSGYFAGLISGAGAIGVAALLAGHRWTIAWSRLESGRNLTALGACLAVSVVASWHLRREADLRERLRSSGRAAEFEATLGIMQRIVASLRARADRTWTSLSFLRDAAGRLDGPDPVSAAEGAVDLALARTGADAAAVRVGTNAFQRLLAVRDARGSHAEASLSRVADLTVPLRDGDEVIGVMALWGLSSPLDTATTTDLELIASWCAGALRPRSARPLADPPYPQDRSTRRPTRNP